MGRWTTISWSMTKDELLRVARHGRDPDDDLLACYSGGQGDGVGVTGVARYGDDGRHWTADWVGLWTPDQGLVLVEELVPERERAVWPTWPREKIIAAIRAKFSAADVPYPLED